MAGTWDSRDELHHFPAAKRLYGNLWTRQQWLDSMQIHLKAAGWVARPSDDWATTDLEITGPGPCKAWLSSVYEDDVEHAAHYVRYRVTVRRRTFPLLIGLALMGLVIALLVFRPDFVPLAIPILVYLGLLSGARKNMASAISQLAVECGKPFAMTPAQDDF